MKKLSDRMWTFSLLWFAAAVPLTAQTFNTVHTFDGTDGYASQAALIQATDGYLYATTAGGGTSGEGTVFKMTPLGVLNTIASFSGADGNDPVPAVVQGTDGNFYGTTGYGGTSTNCSESGCGSIFKMTPNGTVTSLYSFNVTDGYNPSVAPLVQGTDGNFYGTALNGGERCSCGTVFKISPTGDFTLLHRFSGGTTDGGSPYSGLIQASDGNFYGVTYTSGAGGEGTIYKMTPGGSFSTFFTFAANGENGDNPLGGLVQASNGNLYGTTTHGGSGCVVNGIPYGCGTIFEVTLDGVFTTLHTFSQTEGGIPLASLVQGSDGNLYGTAQSFGSSTSCSNGCGTIFEITPSGAFTLLYSFCSDSTCPDGNLPVGGLMQDTNGLFYGTTPSGGANNDGTVYSLSVGLKPFVNTKPNFGGAGTAVTILGNSLAGTTSVTFNGVPATFTVVSESELTTTVPTGASSGKVQVETSTRTLNSNVRFRVLP
jgi:uncharacterized repeat protein (TIGR03803 family)